MAQEIILASQSPRRKQLLEWAEVKFRVITADTDEHFPSDMDVETVPVYIARGKALAVKEKAASADQVLPILAADTIVVLNGRVIGKPRDRADAIDILKELSGQKHQVITGVVLLFEGKETSFSEITEVEFHELTRDQIVFYVDNYKPYDKAGAYAIQEWIGVVGIKRIHGCFYNVMGLPVSRVVQMLNHLSF